MEDEANVLNKTISVFTENTRSPEIYVQSQQDKAQEFKTLTKTLYDKTWRNLRDFSSEKSKSLSKLITSGFDDEQVWQQLELENNFILPTFIEKISNINTNELTLGINVRDSKATCHNKKDNLVQRSIEDDESIDGNEDEYAFDGDSDSSMDPSQNNGYVFDGDSDSSTEFPPNVSAENEMLSEINEKKNVKKKRKLPKSKPSKVDDHFFKLSQLEEFLKIEDLKAEKGEDVGLDDDINLFEDIPSENDEDEDYDDDDQDVDEEVDDLNEEDDDLNEEDDQVNEDFAQDEDVDEADEEEGDETDESWEKKKNKSSRDLMYQDFFDPPESDQSVDEDELSDHTNETSHQKDHNLEEFDGDNDATEDHFKKISSEEKDTETQDTSNLGQFDDFIDTIGDQEETYMDEIGDIEKTPFELEQEKIVKQIYQCERRLLQSLPWELTGEIDAKKRPANSLLKLDTEFDVNAKPDLVIDDELTERTENIIKMAIMNRAWHDVVRKVKTMDEMIAYKKETELEMTKSKKGLAEVYEEDYLKQKEEIEEKEDPKHTEINKLMDALFPELHALFTHIPKPPVPDIKVVSNLPAITVEDVAPTTMTDAHLLAPQEVKKKVGLLKGSSERTGTDKKRERRKKKVHQKLKYKKIEEKASAGGKLTDQEKLIANVITLKKLKQHRNTKILEPTKKIVKSSKDFFSHLQETIDKKRPRPTESSVKVAKKVKTK